MLSLLRLVLKSLKRLLGLYPLFVIAWKRNGNHVGFVFIRIQRGFLRTVVREEKKFIGRVFYIPLPLVEAILKRIL